MATKSWLMSYCPHTSEWNHWIQAATWTVFFDDNIFVESRDLLFIGNNTEGIFAWGIVIDVKRPEHPNSRGSISIARGHLDLPIVESKALECKSVINDLLKSVDRMFTPLTASEANAIAKLMGSAKAPPIGNRGGFVLNKPIDEEEDLRTEFKDVAFNSIPKIAYDYAQAFQNQDGGALYFGIRDADRTVAGLRLNYKQRDEVKQKTEAKLSKIKPPLLPGKHYTLDFYPVCDEVGCEIDDCNVFVVEIRSHPDFDVQSAGGSKRIKTFSGKTKLS